MKERKNWAIVYATLNAELPEANEVGDAEVQTRVATADRFDVFVYADLVRGEGLLGHRGQDMAFRLWATPGLRDAHEKATPLAPEVLRMVVALVRSRDTLTALEAYQLGNPGGPPMAEPAARALLHRGLAAIDFRVAPNLRLSTAHRPGLAGLPPRFGFRFGWAATLVTGKRHRPLQVCILVTEDRAPLAVGLDLDPLELVPTAAARPARKQATKPKADRPAKARQPRKSGAADGPRRRRKPAEPVTETETGTGTGEDAGMGQVISGEAFLLGLSEGRVYQHRTSMSLSFNKPT